MTETRNNPLTTAEFAALGNGQVAYLKPIMSDELARIFPQAPSGPTHRVTSPRNAT